VLPSFRRTNAPNEMLKKWLTNYGVSNRLIIIKMEIEIDKNRINTEYGPDEMVSGEVKN
jgi:tellurite resistance-related uncharacterized protein